MDMRDFKFRAWSMLDKAYIDLWDIPYNEIFCKTPDTRPLIIEQYTGLKDKDGEELYYNSDVVILLPIGLRAYAFKGYFDCPHWICENGSLIDWIEYFNKYPKDSFRIIGNKLINPELI